MYRGHTTYLNSVCVFCELQSFLIWRAEASWRSFSSSNIEFPVLLRKIKFSSKHRNPTLLASYIRIPRTDFLYIPHPPSTRPPRIPQFHVMRFWCSSIVSEAVISKSAAINHDGLIRLMPLWLSLTARGAAQRGRMLLLLAAALIDHPSRQEHRVVGPNQCRWPH